MGQHSNMFECGGCSREFDELLLLHRHLQTLHSTIGSYFFEGKTKTAFPKYDTVCIGTQTDDASCHFVTNNNEIEVENSSSDDIYHDNIVDVGEDSLDKMFEDFRNVESFSDQQHHHVFADELDEFKGIENEIIIESPPEILSTTIESKINKKPRAVKTKNKANGHGNKSEKKKTVKDRKDSKKDTLKIHNLDVNTVTWKCDLCFLEMGSKQELKVHKNTNHQFEKNGKVKCNLCCKLLTSRAALKRHLLVHLGLSPFSCEECDKAFRTPSELNHHKLSHSKEKNYVCQYCGEAFSSRTSLRLHIQRCLDIRPFQCNHVNCTKSFRSKNTLLLHERRHTGEKPYICDQCGESFSREDKLVKHTYIHSGDKPFQCSVCPKSFATKDHLWRHKQIHSGKQSFVCNHCGKGFAQNWNLKAHLRQHSGEKPYKCDICGQDFVHNVSRKTHMSKVHQMQRDIDIL